MSWIISHAISAVKSETPQLGYRFPDGGLPWSGSHATTSDDFGLYRPSGARNKLPYFARDAIQRIPGRRVSRSLHECSVDAAELEKMQSNLRT